MSIFCLISSGTSLPDNDARRSLDSTSQIAVYKVCGCASLPDGTLTLEHPVSLINALTLEVDLLEEQAVDLLELHPILLRKFLDIIMQPFDVVLQVDLICIN